MVQRTRLGPWWRAVKQLLAAFGFTEAGMDAVPTAYSELFMLNNTTPLVEALRSGSTGVCAGCPAAGPAHARRCRPCPRADPPSPRRPRDGHGGRLAGLGGAVRLAAIGCPARRAGSSTHCRGMFQFR
jgi:hypothetical protein